MANIEPSKQRLSRITAALCWERQTSTGTDPNTNAPIEQDLSLSQTDPSEDFANLSIDPVDALDEISIEENDENEEPYYGGNGMKEESQLSEEETQMRKTAQALFELEESLLDQHITNIKVSYEGSASWFFLLYQTQQFTSLMCIIGEC